VGKILDQLRAGCDEVHGRCRTVGGCDGRLGASACGRGAAAAARWCGPGAAGHRLSARPPKSSATPSNEAIGKLRQARAVATRFDKRDFVWRGTIDVALIRIWLRDPVP
jgi:hypothetical protein